MKTEQKEKKQTKNKRSMFIKIGAVLLIIAMVVPTVLGAVLMIV